MLLQYSNACRRVVGEHGEYSSGFSNAEPAIEKRGFAGDDFRSVGFAIAVSRGSSVVLRSTPAAFADEPTDYAAA